MKYVVLFLFVVGFVGIVPNVFASESLFHGTSNIERLPSPIVTDSQKTIEIKIQYVDGPYSLSDFKPIIDVSPKEAAPYVHVEFESIDNIYRNSIKRIFGTVTIDREIPSKKIFLIISYVGTSSNEQISYKSDWSDSAIIDIRENITSPSLDKPVESVPFSYPPPLKFNLESDVSCNRDLVLVSKYDGTPACVFIGTYSKLVERGWAKYDETLLNSYRQQILFQLREGPQNISSVFKNFITSEALHDKILSGILYGADYETHCCSYNLDRPTSIAVAFQSDEKSSIITAEYDLNQEKITHIETNPIINGIKSTFVKNSQEQQLEKTSFTTIKPNTAKFFYYPDPAVTKDNYKMFMLIRLPEWMGGNANDTSAFRAYSAKALDDPCIIKYWGDEGRQRIENPCQGGMYRVVDGALTYGATHRSTAMTALPYLDLSMDENGMLSVEPPKFTKDENGVIGYGREMTISDLRKGSEFLVESFAKHYSNYPPIPIDFAGYLLSEITPDKYETIVRYLDFQSKSGDITMRISKTAQYGSGIDFAEHNKEFWQIGDTVIKVGGSALDKNSDRPEYFQTYLVQFKDDSNYFAIEGKNIEFIKKEIVRNYFPEYDYDEMFLVSSTVE